jgi:hypothetical protein
MTWPNSFASSASRSSGIASFFTVDCFGGAAEVADEEARPTALRYADDRYRARPAGPLRISS